MRHLILYQRKPKKSSSRVQGRTEVEFKYINDRGDIQVKRHPFEGILNTLNAVTADTESSAVRGKILLAHINEHVLAVMVHA